MDIPGEPAPWLHRHPSEQRLLSYYEPVRQRAPRPVLSAFGLPPRHAPSRRPRASRPERRTFRRSPSHVPCKSRRPGSRRLYAGHRLANNRVTARLISKGLLRPPISMPSAKFSTPQQRTPDLRSSASGTSSWSPPDRIKPGLFPDRSPRRSSANAAPGGLTPTPEGRRRRANKPPSLAQLRLWNRPSTCLLLQRS